MTGSEPVPAWFKGALQRDSKLGRTAPTRQSAAARRGYLEVEG
jgi:hypothetical protein